MSLLLMKKVKALTLAVSSKTGLQSIDSGEFTLEDCKVPAENLIGGEEAWPPTHLGWARLRSNQRGCSRRRRGTRLDKSVACTRFAKPLASRSSAPATRSLAEMATRVEAGRLLLESAAKAYDSGDRCDMEAGMAKPFCTEAALENSTRQCESTALMVVPRSST